MTIKLNPIPQTPLRDDPTQDAIWKRFLQFWINKIQTLGAGSVTSVAISAPTEFVVSGSPVTTSGTLTLTKKVENANKGWFGPTTGADAQPTFRALVAADLPAGTGTVTSVNITGNDGIVPSGGPITTSGSITLDLGDITPTSVSTGDLTSSGDTTLGDAAGDELAINAGAWILGNAFIATRTVGTAATGTVHEQEWNTTFTGDAGGATDLTSDYLSLTTQGSADIIATTGRFTLVTHNGGGGASFLIGNSSQEVVNTTGDIGDARSYNSLVRINSSGSISSMHHFRAEIPQLFGTGTIGGHVGFISKNLGHASLVNTAIGHDAEDITASVSTVAGFRSQIAAGTAKYGFLATGTADNSYAGPIYPPKDGKTLQTACALYAGSGAPNNSNGNDGDFYFRSDGGLLTTIYQRRGGTWTGIV